MGSEGQPMFDHEAYLGEMPKGGRMGLVSHDNHTFIVRSTDMKFRAKVVAQLNRDTETNLHYKYILTFKNIMNEGKAMELKHSSSGYLWLEPGQQTKHRTDAYHDFELRDNDRQPMFSVEPMEPSESEL